MYINKPLIKVERMRVPSRQSQLTTQRGQYLLDIIRQLEQIENSWAKILKTSDDQIQKAKKYKIDVEDDQAFLQCQTLLEEQYEAEEEKFSKVRRQLKVAMQTVEEHVEICEAEKKERAQEIQKLKAEIEELQGEESTFGKKAKRKHEMRDKIEQYTRQIEASSVRLQAAKEKSYEQKGLYLQTQELEMNLLEEIGKVEDEEKMYFEFKDREEKYKQLSRIVEKLHAKANSGSRNVQHYLKEKINSMAHLRTNILALDQKLVEYNNSLEEQAYVMDGLKRRAHEDREQDDQLFKKYQSKYEKLYFSRNNDIDNWKNYKAYLQELLKKDQMEPYLKNSRTSYSPNTGSPGLDNSPIRRATQHNRRYSNLRTEPGLMKIDQEEEDLEGAFRRSRGMSRSLRNDNSLHLPKLVKMTGRNGESGKIKENLKRMINESDVSLESVNSDQALSGEFIEVQFHKK